MELILKTFRIKSSVEVYQKIRWMEIVEPVVHVLIVRLLKTHKTDVE